MFVCVCAEDISTSKQKSKTLMWCLCSGNHIIIEYDFSVFIGVIVVVVFRGLFVCSQMPRRLVVFFHLHSQTITAASLDDDLLVQSLYILQHEHTQLERMRRDVADYFICQKILILLLFDNDNS